VCLGFGGPAKSLSDCGEREWIKSQPPGSKRQRESGEMSEQLADFQTSTVSGSGQRLKAVDYAEALAIRVLVSDEPMNAMAGSLHVAKSCRADTRLRGKTADAKHLY